ncbi:MAG: hypothetical protein ACRD3W_22465, partial [Terriglobales bacterium]
PRWQDRLDFVASHSCFFYGRRWRLQHDATRAIQGICTFLKLVPPEKSVKMVEPGQAGFSMEGLEDVRWKSSLKEYRIRYSGINENEIALQGNFLDNLLTLCQQRRIKLILVNMPLTSENRALLPRGFYDRYRDTIETIVRRHSHVQYADIGSDKGYTRSEFYDSAHLNERGGYKLLTQLLPMLEGVLKRKPAN